MTRKQTTPTRALALVRISDDRKGEALGVGRQEEDCRALAARRGWEIAEVVVENDTSAYRTRTVRDENGRPRRVTIRPRFEEVLDALNSGRADGLIVYDVDRLARQPYDLERLIDLVTVRRVPIESVTGSVDLSTDAGVAMARVMVAMANKQSADTARRVRRAARQAAESGRPNGGTRPYGYEREGMTVVPEEARVIREIADRFIAGDSARAIVRYLEAEGIPAPKGARWSTQGVRSVVTKPTVAGLRVHAPDPDEDPVYYPGDWQPILDRETWETVRHVLGLRQSHSTTRASKHLLSGIATCGRCGEKLTVGRNGRRTLADGRKPEVYRCARCHLTRSKAWCDDQVSRVVVRLLERDVVAEARKRQEEAAPGVALTKLAALRERRRQLVGEAALAVDLDPADVRSMLRTIDARIAELEAEVATEPSTRIPEAVEFSSLPLDRRRAIVRELVRVRIVPTSRRGKIIDPESIVIEPAY